MTIWRRMIFFHLLAPFLFFLFSIFLIYVAIDLSLNGVNLLSLGQIHDLSIHYFCHFAKFFDLFVSTAFLFASLKALLQLQQSREIFALQMAGLSKRKLLVPFFWVALSLLILSYANCEWILPKTGKGLDPFFFQEKNSHISSVVLKDGTEVVYQKYNVKEKELFDLFWIKNPDEIWYIKYLDIKNFPPEGHFVEHLVRNEEECLVRFAAHEKMFFPNFDLSETEIFLSGMPLEGLSLSELLRQALFQQSAKNKKSAAHFHYKLALPTLPLLMLLILSPICLSYSRKRSYFLLITLFLFLFIVLRIFLDAMLILAENQLFSPAAAIWIPLFIEFSIAILLLICIS